ncbi:MAG: hypothetical protein R3F60_03735 [bacterium]
MRQLSLALALGAVPAVSYAQQCYPTNTSFAWSQPANVPIADDAADRWPTDATIRLAYGGQWCPDAEQFELRNKDDGSTVAAQVRIRTPVTVVENTAQALTVIDIDPEQPLGERTDYQLIVRPPNPSLPAFAEYQIEFRTRATPMDDVDVNAFEGIRRVGLDGDTCGDNAPYAGVNANVPACLVSSKFRMKLEFQPLNRSEISYAIYRTSTTPLDEMTMEPIALEADNTRVPIDIQPGGRDVTGAGVPIRPVIFEVLYAPLPRRDCYTVVMLDEYGRERGDFENTACVDLVVPEPCPRGCEGAQCMVVFPPPNPFETNEPIPGQMCPSVGLNGGDPDRPIPPVGEEPDPGAGGAGGGGNTDGGVPAGDGGQSEGGGGGSDGCGQAPGTPAPWAWLALLPVLFLRRRR